MKDEGLAAPGTIGDKKKPRFEIKLAGPKTKDTPYTTSITTKMPRTSEVKDTSKAIKPTTNNSSPPVKNIKDTTKYARDAAKDIKGTTKETNDTKGVTEQQGRIDTNISKSVKTPKIPQLPKLEVESRSIGKEPPKPEDGKKHWEKEESIQEGKRLLQERVSTLRTTFILSMIRGR